MLNKKRFSRLTILTFSSAFLFSEPKLADYLSNDLELRRLSLELNKAQLSAKSTSIDNGFDVQLSTGTATFSFNGDDSYMKFEPSAKLSVPQASNLGVGVSTKISNGSSSSSKTSLSDGSDSSSSSSASSGSSDSSTTVKDTKISVSADIISGNMLTRKIALKKAERNLLEAQRNLSNYALKAENEYYKTLRSLFESSSSIISAQKTMYDDTIDFEEIKAKGYSTTSSKYRQAQMKVLSDKHNVETKIHALEHDCAVFASKCGITYESGTHPREFLPKTIPVVEALDILSFEKEKYTKIESANWAHELASLNREAEKNFTLSANAGYTIKNSGTSKKTAEGGTKESDTVDVGLEAGFSGLSVGAGAQIPVDGSAPIYTMSASVKPNSFRKLSIKKKQNQLDEEQELIAIQSAENSYDDDVVDRQTELADIKWSKETNQETYQMYVTLESDMARYLKAGVITESEYLNSFANKELYRIKLLMNDIDMLVYNNELKLLFCRD